MGPVWTHQTLYIIQYPCISPSPLWSPTSRRARRHGRSDGCQSLPSITESEVGGDCEGQTLQLVSSLLHVTLNTLNPTNYGPILFEVSKQLTGCHIIGLYKYNMSVIIIIFLFKCMNKCFSCRGFCVSEWVGFRFWQICWYSFHTTYHQLDLSLGSVPLPDCSSFLWKALSVMMALGGNGVWKHISLFIVESVHGWYKSTCPFT